MLNLLVKYAEDHGLALPPGFAPKTVRWAILCDSDGRFQEVMELGDTAQKRNRGMTFPKCPDLPPFVVAAGDKGERRSHFLVETAQVVALYGVEPDDAKLASKHRYFVHLLREASPAMPEIAAAARMLEDAEALARIRAALTDHKARPVDSVTIAVDGTFLVESDAWHEWWRGWHAKLTARGGEKRPMRCFVTGELAPPLEKHPKIKRLGGQPSGDALISFDKAAFRSYGLKASANAAVSEDAAAAYAAALNDLVSHHSQRLAGDLRILHWFAAAIPEEDDPLAWLEGGEETAELDAQARARKLLQSIRTGERADLGDNQYYVLTVSPMAGRIMVRDWMQGQFEELVANINAWFDDQAIVRRDGTGWAPPPKFRAILAGLVRSLDEIPSPLVARLWRAAVNRGPIPREALSMALHRMRADIVADQVSNHARMGLMKAYHLRKEGGSPIMPHLNEDHPHPAYHCGRLMAVYAALQYAAQGDVGAGVVQRYYAAASATPGLILGRMARLSQFHLNKLEGGLAHWYESKLADIWARIGDAPPATLDLEEQSLFALGYYQQMAADRAGKPDKSETDENTKEENDD